MISFLLFSFLLNGFIFTTKVIAAQVPTSSASLPAQTTFVSITPEMSASSVASFFNALATATPQQPGEAPLDGGVGSTAGPGNSDAGAAGSESGSLTISTTGIIAIVVCVSVVVLFGIASSILWYVAKKRSWEVRKTLRRSARKVATALTPRRSTFPKDVQNRRSKRGLTKIDEVPPTPRLREDFGDIEKGSRNGNSTKISAFELSEPPKKSKWAQKK